MTLHYTYVNPETTRLCQGDILWKKPDLLSVLAKYHSHYATHESYRYFMVLTQSCDLYCDNEREPTSRYISLAAVRPVEEAIRREALGRYGEWLTSRGVLGLKAYNELSLFTESLFDNNVPNYFYIHEELALGISGQNCAFLALSIALKIDHYELCLSAKRAQLKEQFQAKLGWLAGNMYSRVGTEEWNDHYEGSQTVGKEAAKLLGDMFACFAEEQIDKGVKELLASKEVNTCSADDVLQAIQAIKLGRPRTVFGKRVEEVVDEFRLVDSVGSRIVNAIKGDSGLRTDLSKIIEGRGDVDTDALCDDLVGCVVKRLRSVATDDTIPNRDRIVRKLAGAIKADAEIRSLFS